ncbi:hypothetical protein [Stagnihabitans tardus]|uniref:Uncharacterized protein n=1 Tax=Stagnihabitans tardus TaxID=2699202 RepID=A0AAE5BUF3_9RHOB|nr:hypothetical protein [Stagnihabitans tardus]NBZ90065.1 hypothetical protein [Stagnihabitans tardus]
MSIQGWLVKARAQRVEYERQAKQFHDFSARVGFEVARATDPLDRNLGIARSLAYQSAQLAAEMERRAETVLNNECQRISPEGYRTQRKSEKSLFAEALIEVTSHMVTRA